MTADQYMAEYIGRLSHTLGYFWPAGEELPDADARELEIFLKVSIERLDEEWQGKLVQAMRNLADPMSGFFDREVAESGESTQIILRIIARFPQLQEALELQKQDFLRRYRFVA